MKCDILVSQKSCFRTQVVPLRLDGARLEACYAQFGCDIDEVTDHYAKAAGIAKKDTK
jgi:hypothetical protein